jgi:hypothetical protein
MGGGIEKLNCYFAHHIKRAWERLLIIFNLFETY